MNGNFKRMMAVAVLATAGAMSVALAQLPPATVLEASIETTTDQVIWPLSMNGRLQVRDCRGCQHATLQLDAHTRFNLAGQNVSLKEMAAYASSKRGQPLDIHYRLSDTNVSLVSVLTK